ncbi:hypothetical protein U1Q18_028430 [Sarracenia purpurea var. burkii]
MINVFEELANLLSKSALPVNCPLSSMHLLALDGLITVILGMAERISSGLVTMEPALVNLEEYTPFWMVKCESYSDPDHWVPYTVGLDKNLVGDFLGNHDEFCVQVLNEFAGTFDMNLDTAFQLFLETFRLPGDMNLDTAFQLFLETFRLPGESQKIQRLFLETFRLPGESQKIQRVLEAFSERYYEQSPPILANKDAALLLSYSLIMLNTDQHNVQVKKKMTEEDFIRNKRHINGGSDLPRKFLLELYQSICKNEIRTTPEQKCRLP